MTRFGFVSTYPPTRCGLASFTHSLAKALTGPRDAPASIVRMLDPGEGAGLVPDDAGRVVAVVRTDDPPLIVAPHGALSDCDVVIVQHEYGIFGGRDGDEVLELLEALDVPSIVVLHTVLAVSHRQPAARARACRRTRAPSSS